MSKKFNFQYFKIYQFVFYTLVLFVGGILYAHFSPKYSDKFSIEAHSYLNHVFNIFESHSIYKNQIAWKKIKNEVLREAHLCQSYEDIYKIIRNLLHQVGDKHGFLLRADQLTQRNTHTCNKIDGYLIENGIGYINLPMCTSLAESLNQKYAEALQNIIKKIDNANVDSWIIDLRKNYGGNLWPMLLGLGPIIGNKTLGYFVDAENKYTPFSYNKGSIKQGDSIQLSLPNTFYKVKCLKPFIAILISSSTASSGEIVTIALKNKAYSRVFGEQSSGLTSGTQMFKLKDGAHLLITTSHIADCAKRIHPEQIIPDIVVSTDLDDKIFKEAINWIKTSRSKLHY